MVLPIEGAKMRLSKQVSRAYKVLMTYKASIYFCGSSLYGANEDLRGEQAVAYERIRVYRPLFVFRGLLWTGYKGASDSKSGWYPYLRSIRLITLLAGILYTRL